jgi:M6 family metalloprotease-like protein
MPIRAVIAILIALFLTTICAGAAQLPQSPVTAASAADTSGIALNAEDVAQLTAALDRMEMATTQTAETLQGFAQARLDLQKVGSLTGKPAVQLSRAVLDQLDALAAASPLSTTPEEFGIRSINELGTPECPPADAEKARCAPVAWLSTTSPNFHTISKQAYLRGNEKGLNTVRTSASFVATAAATNVAIVFSAEAYVQNGLPNENQRMFVRALLDGQPTAPGDVVFATTSGSSARAFIFTASVGAGIHTVEMQWRVDPSGTGYMRDVSLLVRTGSGDSSTLGSLVVKTPPSGPSVTINNNVWSNVPDMNAWVFVPENGVLTASLSAESKVTNGKRVTLSAYTDSQLLLPTDVIFAKGAATQSRLATFVSSKVPAGWRKVTFRWAVENGGTAEFGDRSLALMAYPSSSLSPTHPAVAAPSGPSIESPSDGSLVAIADMKTSIHVPATGNGEVAVQFSAEVGTKSGALAGVVLAVDGNLTQYVTLSDGQDGPQLRSWIFSAKGLKSGAHSIELFWYGGNGVGLGATMGDRVMAVSSETGFIPDLAEAPRFGGGHIGVDKDNIGGVEALIGERKVLTILWDPHHCDADDSDPPDCYDQTDIPKSKVESALYGTAPGLGFVEPENVKSYFTSNSTGRFTMVNAGILGWYDASHPADYYTNHPGQCVDGFEDGTNAIFKDAVLQADAAFNFASYDVDGNGELDSSELAIVVIIPRPIVHGSSLVVLLDGDCENNTRLSADGVLLPQHVAKVNTSLDAAVQQYQFAAIAHELMHVIGGLDDLYFDDDTAVYPRNNALMADSTYTSSHLDPMHKLALGWVTPKLITSTGELTAIEIKQSDSVYILPRYNNLYAEEYFIIENRQRDMGDSFFDDAINDSGIAVWHVVSDRTQNIKAPVGVTTDIWETLHFTAGVAGSKGQMGRNGLRLIRPFQSMYADGTAIFLDGAAKNNVFWDKTELGLHSGACAIGPTTLTWSDCSASGYSLDFLSFPSNIMKVNITVD